MYYCFDCENTFETPDINTVHRAGEPSFDQRSCPKCGSDDVVLLDDDMAEFYSGEEQEDEV